MATNAVTQEQSTGQTGLLDLEKELTCSICTDLLHQPLTLLDCLHTFCGSCLKEWFLWQKAAAKQKRRDYGRSAISSQNIYTCPSCRAAVRGTRPNATVTTLLEMYLQANPTKGKTETEKNEVAEHYKVGENVLPRHPSPSPAGANRSRRDVEDQEAEDDALVEEVRQMSIRELERRGTRSNRGERATERDARNRRRNQMLNSSPASRDATATRNDLHITADQSPESEGRQRQQQQTTSRSLEHQSSLRSLLTSSDLDSMEMEEEIMRQIMEEGLLDGIDLSNIDRQEEDEISERIAQAYRTRQRDRARVIENTARQTARNTQRERSQGAPSSYQVDQTTRNGHRSSSQGSSSSARRHRQPRSSGEYLSRATTGPVETLDTLNTRNTYPREHRRMLSHERRSTDPDRARGSPRSSVETFRSTSDSVTASAQPRDTTRSASLPVPTLNLPQESSASDHETDQTIPTSVQPHTPPLEPTPQVALRLEPLGPTPFLYCSGCSRPRIQHELHYICAKCPPTTGSSIYALCLRCYRTGHGCPKWYGFGESAAHRYTQAKALDPVVEPPHLFQPEKYLKQTEATLEASDSSLHLTGVFCDICHDNANDCYWRCLTCNDGEWGFCNSCVNKARHCTHPLLPMFWNPVTENIHGHNANDEESGIRCNASKSLPLEALPVHTTCNSCLNPIPPSSTRYHCPKCSSGDHDICTTCYHSAVATGKLSRDDGPHGWRKCESGHRMLLVGFESRPEGQQRVVVESIVGGWQMADENAVTATNTGDTSRNSHERPGRGRNLDGEWSWRDTTSGSWKSTRYSTISSQATRDTSLFNFPPSGGYGARMTAVWTHLPDDGEEDELMFPKKAQITEVLSINEDWSWGVYCGKGGLLPKAFLRVDR